MGEPIFQGGAETMVFVVMDSSITLLNIGGEDLSEANFPFSDANISYLARRAVEELAGVSQTPGEELYQLF